MKYSFVDNDGLMLLIIADKKHLVKTMKFKIFLYNVLKFSNYGQQIFVAVKLKKQGFIGAL